MHSTVLVNLKYYVIKIYFNFDFIQNFLNVMSLLQCNYIVIND